MSDFETRCCEWKQLIQLRPNIRIPDNGEMNWPLFVPDDFVVQDVKLTVAGLYHPHAEDLT